MSWAEIGQRRGSNRAEIHKACALLTHTFVCMTLYLREKNQLSTIGNVTGNNVSTSDS